ncbi:zinc ribbon domain-containing protein [Streptomyces sp. NPDC096324]|uniref:zinc ribbon domain-containing protein n=1 Tax=Streptomyces sp. NPDC096324 TaxID=3366085 RepID=UPI0037FAD7BE
MLEYKAALHGRTFAKVHRAFPSSQVCSARGFRDGPKPLHVRERTCGECHAVHDRDHNAARDVLFEGRRIVTAGRVETPNACGVPVGRAHVPHSALKQEATGRVGRPRPGTPGLQSREHVNRSPFPL